MHTSKATRRIAAPILNKIETETNQTLCHTEMFRSFLRNPRVTKANKVWEELTTDAARASLAGPLRMYHIKEHSAEIEKKYTKSYDAEESLVVIFDEKGTFIGFYKFVSLQFYEDYATRDVMTGGDHLGGTRVFNSRGARNTSMPNMALFYTNDEDKWTGVYQAQTEYEWDEGWLGSFNGKSYIYLSCSEKWTHDMHKILLMYLIKLSPIPRSTCYILGVLSPTEALFVLMHALSSDTRVIYVMIISFFDSFEHNFELDDFDEEDSYYQQAVELREKLSQVSYTLEDDEFVKLVEIIFARAAGKLFETSGNSDDEQELSLGDICNPIATHYGWSKVDERRQNLIFQHLMNKKAPTGDSSSM